MLRPVLAGAAMAATAFISQGAQATTLSGNLTADNAFYAFISTNDAVLGTLVESGNSWPTTYSFSGSALTPGVTNYLQIEAINGGGPGGFIGTFTLSDASFHFGNSGQTISTDTVNWTGIYNDAFGDYGSPSVQPWVTPTGGVAQMTYGWGTPGGIDPGALWIWSSDSSSGGTACGVCTVDLSTPIIPEVAATPLPSTWSMLLLGFAGLGFFGHRGARNSSAAVVAA